MRSNSEKDGCVLELVHAVEASESEEVGFEHCLRA